MRDGEDRCRRLWTPLCGFQAAVDGALPVHGCGSVHAVVELREDTTELHHLTGHYPHRSASAAAHVVYYVFDVLVLSGQDVSREPLQKRRELLEKKVLPKLPEPVRYSAPLDAELPVLIESVKAHGFEGLVAKRRNSPYEPGLRSGAWMKMRVNRGQEFVIGGYTRGTRTFDALIFGYYEGNRLIYVARTRNGSHPRTRHSCSRSSEDLRSASVRL